MSIIIQIGFRRTWEMRKSREEAAQTRKHIVRAAARQFREKGIAATGLAELMKAAGLTHGGVYKHFGPDDRAVAAAPGRAARPLRQGRAAQPARKQPPGAHLPPPP